MNKIKNLEFNKDVFKNKNFFIIIIFLGFCFSVILSSYYVIKYDKYVKGSDIEHQLIKDETFYHWSYGAKIANEVRQGKNFFLAGGVTFTKPLQQRIIALYSLVTGYELIDLEKKNLRVTLGGKIPYLIIQGLIYFLSLLFFAKKLLKTIPNYAFLYVICFLSFEFTIFQYHSSFWTESIYFSLQLIIFGMLLEKKTSFYYNLIIGLLLGFLFLQRTAGVFYIFPILLCSFFLFRKKIIPVFFGIVTGFIIIVTLLGLYNQYQTNKFYIFPLEGKYSLYSYFAVPKVLSKKLNVSTSEALKQDSEKMIDWIRKNNIELNSTLENISSPTMLKNYFKNEVDKIKFLNKLSSRSHEILLDNPILTIKAIIENTLHLIILNPVHNHYYNESRGKNKIGFINTDTHKKLIPYRIVYTLIIYLFCLIGFISLYKQKKFYELSLVTLSVLYYVALFGWYGKTRLYVPSLIYLSVFFGVGLNVFINYLKKVEK